MIIIIALLILIVLAIFSMPILAFFAAIILARRARKIEDAADKYLKS